MTQLVYIGGSKGGSGKTSTAHLGCLGASLSGHAAAYVLTDVMRQLRGEGRPYAVLDGRNTNQLAIILESSRQRALPGWVIVDGGGNRPALDLELATEADLCLLPFRASEEDLDTVATDLKRLPRALAVPTAWPTNKFAIDASKFLIDALEQSFPGRVIGTPIPFVNSVSDLLAAKLGSPSTPSRSLAKMVFALISQAYEKHCQTPKSDQVTDSRLAAVNA
jgi:chromosome partitioning protein